MQDSAGYLPVRVWRMRKATTIDLTETDRLALSAIVRDRNSPQKVTAQPTPWRKSTFVSMSYETRAMCRSQ